MKKIGLLLALIAVFVLAADASAYKNANGKFALHYAGLSDAKAHTCDFSVSNCMDLVVTADVTGPAEVDVYLIAIDVSGIAGWRTGIDCTGPIAFYGWTSCGAQDIPTSGWPECGEANASGWPTEQPGPNVVLGILDIYIYAGTETVFTTTDGRVGYSEFCDGSTPFPICERFAEEEHFQSVGFNGTEGVNKCSLIPVEQRSWGAVKALYR